MSFDDGSSAGIETTAERRFRRELLALWIGQLLSAIGDRMHEIALVWIAVGVVGERAGWVIAVGSMSRLLFGLPGGVFADRWHRKHTMIACDVFRALAVGSLLFVDLDSPDVIWALAAVAFVVGAFDSLFQPALQASLPLLAPDLRRLQSANAWLDITRRLAVALGPSATGALLAVLPLRHFFTLDAVTFAVSGAMVLSLGSRHAWRPESRVAAGERPASMFSDVLGAARLLRADRTLSWGLAQIGLWNLLLTPAMTLGLALLVSEELGGGPALLGYLTGAYGAGNVASNLVLTRAAARRTARVMHLGAIVAGTGWLLLANTGAVPLLLLLIAFTAVGGPMTDIMLLRLIQTGFPSSAVGRIYSFRYTLSRSAQAIGLALAVPLYAWMGVRPGISAGAVLLIAFAATGLWRSERRG